MGSPVLIVGAALGAAYFATRGKDAKPAPMVRDNRAPNAGEAEISGGIDATAAAANPGTYVSTTGGEAESSHGGVELQPVTGGSTSKTPSGDTTGGDTSTTPSGGGITAPVIGTMATMDDSSSPSGPVADEPTVIPWLQVKYGYTSGLTYKQQSQSLSQEGPALGLVW